jgi:hypothetical protein
MRHGPAGGEHLRKEIRLLTREMYRAWIARLLLLLLLLLWHHNWHRRRCKLGHCCSLGPHHG